MAGPMGRFDYTSDNGTVYQIRLDASNAAAVGATAATSDLFMPRAIKPRYLLAQHPSNGRERKIVVPDPGAAIWTGAGGTLSLPDFAAAIPIPVTNFAVRGRVGEKRYSR